MNIFLLSYISTKSTDIISNLHFKSATIGMYEFEEMLKTTAEKVANNKQIVTLLNSHRTIDSYTEATIEDMKNEISIFEGALNTLSFIKTVNIISLEGDYLFSNETFINDFVLEDRPWFNSEDLDVNKDAFFSNLHGDYSSGKYTASVIKYIFDGNTPIGAVILDIYMEEFLKFIDSSFYLGTLVSYVSLENETYISKTGVVTDRDIYTKNNLIYEAKILDSKLHIIYAFDKHSFIFNKEMDTFYVSTSVILCFFGITLYFILIKFISKNLLPVMTSLDKLKLLLNNLEKNNFQLELTDEFEQLEFISESLGKSFDKKLQSLIYYDDLTSLPNRKILLSQCNEYISQGKSFALIFIDLNNFKYINDTFGHKTGDNLLKAFSKDLKDLIGDKGTVTRYSGDEFVIIYKNYINNAELLTFYNSVILNRFKLPLFFSNTNSIVQFSAGVAVYPKDGKTFDELIMKSDFMMYRSKNDSLTHKLMFFNDQIYKEIKRIEDIKFHLKEGIKNDEFLLFYQPILNTHKEVKKVEALIRWNSAALGFISPVDFITYAEEIGEIIPIGYWIIENICKAFNSIFEKIPDLQVNINVSPLQLMDTKFVDTVKALIDTYEINYSNLCFEITESVVIDENSIVNDNLQGLHELGISIALDDFGTGYASFSYLSKYKLDILKIDRIFINNTECKYINMVENIKNIAHHLGMKVVIEGIETQEQFTKLSEIGCDYFQGYYFSKPLCLHDLKKLLLK